MALTDITGNMLLGAWPGGLNPGMGQVILDAATDQIEWIFQMPEDATLTRVGVMQSTLTGTAPVFNVSLQGVTGAGIPDGTVKGGGSPASVNYTPISGNNNTWFWLNLANSYAAARGEWLALVISYVSGTIDASNKCGFNYVCGNSLTAGVPYAINNNAGSRSNNSTSPVFAVGSASKAYGRPCNAASALNFNSASNPDERGLKFVMPTALCNRYKITGAIVGLLLPTNGSWTMTLFDSDGSTILQQTTFDSDIDSNPGSTQPRPYYFDDAPAILTSGLAYRITALPVTGNLSIARFSVANSADLDAYRLGASGASGTQRTDAGAWTDDPLQRYSIDPIISAWEQTSGGGTVLIVE